MSVIASPPASAQQQLTALLHATGVTPLSKIGWIKVIGSDRVRWLNGMTTNSIQALAPGELNYNFFLSSQGRVQGDAVALRFDDSLLLGTDAERVPTLMELLDRFIIMDDVELKQLPYHGLLVTGPLAASTISAIGIEIDSLAPLHFTASNDWRGHNIAVVYAYSPLVPRFELLSESPGAIAALTEALSASGATAVEDEALDHLRILEGTPLYGTDIRDKELPQETNQTRALHFSKGCYLGQEIVERIRSRGNVHRAFHAFQLTGDLPEAGTILEVDGKTVGELTSTATIPLESGPLNLALGYVRREALERTENITFPGGAAHPIPVPYVIEP